MQEHAPQDTPAAPGDAQMTDDEEDPDMAAALAMSLAESAPPAQVDLGLTVPCSLFAPPFSSQQTRATLPRIWCSCQCSSETRLGKADACLHPLYIV